MRTLTCAVAACLVMATAPGRSGHAQPSGDARQGRAEFRMRFSGPVETRAGERLARPSVDYRTWTIPEHTRTRLELPAGRVLVELHSGKLLTVVGDQQQRRQPGEFWTMQPGEALTVQTEDDTAMLSTIVTR